MRQELDVLFICVGGSCIAAESSYLLEHISKQSLSNFVDNNAPPLSLPPFSSKTSIWTCLRLSI